jgi:hypothetical protein
MINVSAPHDKNKPAAGEPENQKSRRKKQKLIRLDDLIPKKDVKGGQQFFGSSDTTTTEDRDR